MVILGHHVREQYTQLKRPTFLDFVLEHLLNLLESVALLGARGFIVEVFYLHILISGSVHDDFYLHSEGFYVLQGVSSKYNEKGAEDHRDEHSEEVEE